jgi:hypothetical protein
MEFMKEELVATYLKNVRQYIVRVTIKLHRNTVEFEERLKEQHGGRL